MKSILTVAEMDNWSRNFHSAFPDKKIGLVPTMGYLHEGHLSLIKQIKNHVDTVVVSIFVNPIQFNNPEDLKKYPRDIKRDLNLLESEGADIVFSPSSENVYPDGPPGIFIDYPEITNKLCGKFRPGHFSGVLTVVHNLFQWVKPHVSIFGQKDYQQLLLIKKLNHDLHMNVKILEGEIVRENDHVAMSSRNVRLSDEDRISARRIPEALFFIRDKFQNDNLAAGILNTFLKEKLNGMDIEYAGIYNPDTLNELNDNDTPSKCLAAVAVNIGQVRLIDNMVLLK